jgi:glycerol-3-phosphate acyltransferase PlsY
MIVWIASIGGLAAAYLLGSIPTGYLAGKLLRGIDIRQHGSGSTGATNVLRTLGKAPALVVVLIDAAKGAAAILLARWLCPRIGAAAWTDWAVCLAGIAALLGHARSIWLGFTGGKSAATGLGVLLAVSWPVGVGAAAMWGLLLALTRVVSIASISAALTAIALIFVLAEPWPYRLLVIAGALYVILRHRANIQRLLAGTEPKVGRSQAKP